MDNVSNGAFVVGALLAGFVLWLLLNDRLGVYWNILIGGSSGTSSTSSTSTSGGTSSGGLTNPFTGKQIVPGITGLF